MRPSQQFSNIGDQVLEDAESVKCSIAEFVEGLEEIIAKLTEAKAAAEESHFKTGN